MSAQGILPRAGSRLEEVPKGADGGKEVQTALAPQAIRSTHLATPTSVAALERQNDAE
jgi:hypothetical protein